MDQIYFDGHKYAILDYGLDYEYFAEMCLGGGNLQKAYQPTMAPEMLHHRVFNRRKSPTWSLGVIMMTLLSSRKVHGKLAQAVLSRSQFDVNQLIHYLNFPLDVQDLLRSMLLLEPEYRISWEEIQCQPLLRFDMEKSKVQPFYEKVKKTLSPTSLSTQQFFSTCPPTQAKKKQLFNLSHYRLKTDLHYQRIASSVQLQASVLFQKKTKVKNQMSQS